MSDTTTATQAPAKAASPTSLAFQKLQQIKSELNTRYLEKREEIDLLLCAAISRQHAALLGPPGEAKTAVTEAFAARITGANYFETLVTKFSTEEALFGLFNPQSMMAGRYEYASAGLLPDANIAFLDEVFKGTPAFLNSLLKAMAERKWRNGNQLQTMPLEFLIGASNELPPEDDENLDALWDRFLFRLQTATLGDTGHRQFLTDELVRRQARASGQSVDGSQGTTISLDELKLLQVAALNVQIPQTIIDGWLQIRSQMESAGYGKPSTRRSGWLMDAIAAHAILYGRKAATLDDLSVLVHCLWQRPGDAKPIAAIIQKIANPMVLAARELADTMPGILATFYAEVRAAGSNELQKSTAGTRATMALNGLKDKLQSEYLKAKGAGRDTSEIARYGNEVREQLRKVASHFATPDDDAFGGNQA